MTNKDRKEVNKMIEVIEVIKIVIAFISVIWLLIVLEKDGGGDIPINRLSGGDYDNRKNTKEVEEGGA